MARIARDDELGMEIVASRGELRLAADMLTLFTMSPSEDRHALIGDPPVVRVKVPAFHARDVADEWYEAVNARLWQHERFPGGQDVRLWLPRHFLCPSDDPALQLTSIVADLRACLAAGYGDMPAAFSA